MGILGHPALLLVVYVCGGKRSFQDRRQDIASAIAARSTPYPSSSPGMPISTPSHSASLLSLLLQFVFPAFSPSPNGTEIQHSEL